MKQDWKSLPPALQHQLIIQMGLAVCCLVLAIGALAFISFSVSVPFLLGAALLTICAARLYRTGMRGQYLILRGVILKVERTVLRQRPKSILLEANGKALLVMLRNRHAAVREGDTVIVGSISRFARNTRDLLDLVERLTAKGVEFVSKKEAIDTTTPSGKFMLTIFGAVAELEREYILQRQREGIAIARERGIYKGRKPIDRPEFQQVVALWRKGGITAVEAMKRLDLKSSTFYRKVRQMEEVR